MPPRRPPPADFDTVYEAMCARNAAFRDFFGLDRMTIKELDGFLHRDKDPDAMMDRAEELDAIFDRVHPRDRKTLARFTVLADRFDIGGMSLADFEAFVARRRNQAPEVRARRPVKRRATQASSTSSSSSLVEISPS
jgi:hypothetical protein